MQWFRNRHVRGRPPHPDVLTPAEWRVLEHLRAGHSNPEIAVRLHVSVNTVRTHVSSMLAKLELSDRHELAAWVGEPDEASRVALGRFGLAAPFGWLREAWVGKVAVGASVVAVSVAAVALISQLQGAGEPATSMPTGTPPAATETPAGEQTAVPTPPSWELAGVFTDPRSTVVQETISIPDPVSPFPLYDRDNLPVHIYDFDTGEVHDMGPGRLPVLFTEDGQYAVWARTQHSLSLDPGVVAALNLETGEVSELIEGQPRHLPEAAPRELAGSSWISIWTGDDLMLLNVATGEQRALQWDPPPGTGQFPVWGELEYRNGRLIDTTAHQPVILSFDAFSAVYVGDGEFVFATTPREHDGLTTSNIFVGDIGTKTASFIATTQVSVQVLLAANERYIAWNERYCEQDGTRWTRTVMLYDRESRVLTELETDMAVFMFDGTRLGFSYSGFGADAWFDLDTMEWREVMPANVIHTNWSADRRYAALGGFGGHGGLCL